MDMYPLTSISLNSIDLFNLYCWIFNDEWQPIPGLNKAKVDIPSYTGLHPVFWDIKDFSPMESFFPVNIPRNEMPPKYVFNPHDQTHHFAAYFWLGAQPFGTSDPALYHALRFSGDIDMNGAVVNPGDVALGILAAKWGRHMRDHPGYIGESVEASLRFATPVP
jgi:hypothetical protein